MSITVALLAYAEEENLKVLIPQIRENIEKCQEDYEILVVDVNPAQDHTEDVCKEYGVRYVNQEEPHFGGAFRTAIKYANKDKFLILDSDGSHLPKYIPRIYHRFVKQNCDVVIGSRYVKGGKTNDSKMSQIMSKILNSTFRICLGIKAKDISTDYRMYRTEQLKKVRLQCDNYDVLQEVLLKLRLRKKNLKIEEVPICFEKRIFGESKRQLFRFIVSYLGTLCRLICIRISKHA